MAGPAPLFREIHRLRTLIHELDEQLGRLPRTFKARQAALAKATEALAAAVDGVKSCKVMTIAKEKALKDKHALIAKYEEQLGTTTSKKEYDAKQMEIAFAKAECTKLEEEAYAAIEQGETLAATVPGLEKAAAAARDEVKKFDADMEAKVALWKAEREQAAAKLAGIEPNVPRDLRQTYEKTVDSMGHDGFAEVVDLSCGGCQGNVTMQDQHALQNEQFVMCPMCGRILYLP